MAITAVREKKPEAAQLFEATRKMSADPSAPQEVRALMAVLQRVLAGDPQPDLSALPEEMAALVRKLLEES